MVQWLVCHGGWVNKNSGITFNPLIRFLMMNFSWNVSSWTHPNLAKVSFRDLNFIPSSTGTFRRRITFLKEHLVRSQACLPKREKKYRVLRAKSYYSSNKQERLTIQSEQSLYFRPSAAVKWNKHGPQRTAQHYHSPRPLSNALWSNCSAVQPSRIFHIWHDAKTTHHDKDHRDITEWFVLAGMLSWRQVSKLQLPYFPSNVWIEQPYQGGKTWRFCSWFWKILFHTRQE